MEVHLLVYDLSRGLARQMSQQLLGFHLDAVYHTSIELNGREYVYDGAIIAIKPYSSHLGQPMEKLPLGSTGLQMDVIEEYLDSLRPSFTVQTYDLFHHNCNNFTDLFSNFLLGIGIPEHIRNMPKAVLETPLGKMLLPQLMQGVNAGRQQNGGSILGLEESAQMPDNQSLAAPKDRVYKSVTSADFYRLLNDEKHDCAIVFFSSATCPPCKEIYPLFDELAKELGDRVAFIYVDISLPGVHEVASHYSVHATPTFITFRRGVKEEEWLGADPMTLRGNVRLLAETAHPLHPHEKLRLPTFANTNSSPVLFDKVPPLDKLLGKMSDNLAQKSEIQALRRYLEERGTHGLQGSAIPDLDRLGRFLQECVETLLPASLFPVVDLFRSSLSDPRVLQFFTKETSQTPVQSVLNVIHVVNRQDDCPYALRLVTLQLSCNLFSSPSFAAKLRQHAELRAAVVQLTSTSFLNDSHDSVRIASSSLLFNLARSNQGARKQNSPPLLPEEDEVELAASLVEAIGQPDLSASVLKAMLTALGYLVYCTPIDGELADLLRALDAASTVLAKKEAFPDEQLITEVGTELLGKGLKQL